MPLFKMRFSIIGIIGLVILALAVATSVWFTRTKSTETRSKAAHLSEIPALNNFELPIVEFGTIQKITGVGSLPQKSLSITDSKPTVLGEETEGTSAESPVIVCERSESGVPVCPKVAPPSPDFCKDGTIVPSKTDACGCVGPPECIRPTPSVPPPTGQYLLNTFDGRTYILEQPTFRCTKNQVCPQFMPPELNFDQYLGIPVMIHGILKLSRCTYAREITDYRCDTLQSLVDIDPNAVQFRLPNWWPLPKQGILEAHDVQLAEPIPIDTVFEGNLIILAGRYGTSNVYLLEDPRLCIAPQCGPKFVRSSNINLSLFLNKKVNLKGPLYLVGNDYFLDAETNAKVECKPLPTCAYEGVPDEFGNITYCPLNSIPDYSTSWCPRPSPTPPPGCLYRTNGPCGDGEECTLTQVCPSPTPTPTPESTPISCKPADITRDGVVDYTDLGAILIDFFKRSPLLTTPTVDINRDGIVDISDYSLFAKDFGSSTGPCI